MKMILAMDKNGCIGKGNDLPWHLPKDLAFFKKVTLGEPVVMGSATWFSLPFRPLPKRLNIVLSRDEKAIFDGAHSCASLEDVRKYGDNAIFIGGATIYNAAIELVDTIYITHVDMEVSEGDTFFDLDNLKKFDKVHSTVEYDNGVKLEFAEYKKRA